MLPDCARSSSEAKLLNVDLSRFEDGDILIMPLSHIQSPHQSTLTSECSLHRPHPVAVASAVNRKRARSTAAFPLPPHHLPSLASSPQYLASALDIEPPCQSSHSLRYIALRGRRAQRQLRAQESLEKQSTRFWGMIPDEWHTRVRSAIRL